MNILHVIERFSGAGPERAIIVAATCAAGLGLHQEHTVCTLEKAGSPVAVVMARHAGVRVEFAPDPDRRRELLARADIVLVHFWNNPALHEFLRSPMPPLRLVVWLTILGGHAPQVVPRPLFDFADAVVATTPGTRHLPEFAGRAARTPVICSMADFARLDGFAPRPHAGYRVGTISGSLDPGKLHPAFVAMSAAVRVPDVRFILCGAGDGTLRRQVQATDVADRFDFRGYREDIRSILEECDVFGYPLHRETSATSEKALQEAMWVGIPPVVFPYAGIRYLVEHGVTGLVVEREADYTDAIEWLYRHPDERRRMGERARRFARRAFEPRKAVLRFASLFGTLAAQPKSVRAWPDDGDTPAAWFIAALGDHAGPFAVSHGSDSAAAISAAEAEIAAIPDFLLKYEGGLIHYRNRWPQDPHLRYWVGRALAHRGDAEHAEEEFRAAAEGGLDRPETAPYRGRAPR